MKRTFARVATTLLAAPLLAAGVAGTAQAESVTVPGCWGATTSAIVCNPTVTYTVPVGVTTYETVVPVCAGTCVDVPVTLVTTTPGQPLSTCVSWTDRAGNPSSRCVDNDDVDGAIDLVTGLADSVRTGTANEIDSIRSNCYLTDELGCPPVLLNALRIVADLVRP